MKAYLVGGAVRDKLLGYPHHERDWVVVGATPAKMLEAGFKPVGKDFPVFLHPQTNEEYALARTERKSGHGYRGFTFYCDSDVTLKQDLARRDLTINAMAEDSDGALIDPYDGRRDLEQKILRHVSPAFAEDPLRVLRVARFAARYHHLGFRVATETAVLMRNIVDADEIEHLVAERIWKETERALNEPNPEIYFQILAQCGALARLLPGRGESDLAFAELALCAINHRDPIVRFAVLCSKLTTPAVAAFCDRIKAPNDYRDLASLGISQLPAIRHCDTPEEAFAILETCDALRRPARFERLLNAALALQIDIASIERLHESMRTAAMITAQPLLQRGFSGKALGEQLQRERLAAIARQWQATN